MILQATVTKYIPTNAYIYADNETKHGFLIDPGAQAGKLLELIREKGLTIEAILLTHGHFDHIGAVSELQETLKIPVYMGWARRGGSMPRIPSGISRPRPTSPSY
ncbi:MBL fold metallo-hydrolase [Mitsuokella multacida]|uniref:MBL fold metallo-hydrolase n=1 Tax=Mitsuokella multacida TaxID=52226 RepID=UPI00242AC89F|nr:MBL fold metallo-hydrolase [Mitsuokella multacida]